MSKLSSNTACLVNYNTEVCFEVSFFYVLGDIIKIFYNFSIIRERESEVEWDGKEKLCDIMESSNVTKDVKIE